MYRSTFQRSTQTFTLLKPKSFKPFTFNYLLSNLITGIKILIFTGISVLCLNRQLSVNYVLLTGVALRFHKNRLNMLHMYRMNLLNWLHWLDWLNMLYRLYWLQMLHRLSNLHVVVDWCSVQGQFLVNWLWLNLGHEMDLAIARLLDYGDWLLYNGCCLDGNNLLWSLDNDCFFAWRLDYYDVILTI